MDRSSASSMPILVLLALALTLPACSAQPDHAGVRANSAMPAGPAAENSTERAPQFAGDWSFSTDCNFGHYVTLSLEENAGVVTGEWTDGTNVRGSQGKLKGVVGAGRLDLQWCSEAEESGGYPLCPQYSKPEGYLVRRDQALVWMKGATEYAVLTRGGTSRRADEECQD